jgi:CPA1 family monovalent cation:H+ antiporter
VAVWNFAEFVLTSLVFILIGLQLNGILERVSGRGMGELAWLAGAMSAALILSRILWVFPATYLPRLIPAVRRADPLPPWQVPMIISWAGMRGVVSLAVALALPLDFPERDLIVFLAFCAILATLVLQGTTLEWLIRRLGVRATPHPTASRPRKRAPATPWPAPCSIRWNAARVMCCTAPSPMTCCPSSATAPAT